MKNIILAALSLVSVACTTTREVRNVDTEILAKSRANDGVVGLNSKNEAIIQKKTDAGVELTIQEHVNENLQSNLNYERDRLKDCRREMKKAGESIDVPDVDGLKNENEVREELGLDEKGSLVVVKKQNLEERLVAEKKYEKALRDLTRVVKKNREECESRTGLDDPALVKAKNAAVIQAAEQVLKGK